MEEEINPPEKIYAERSDIFDDMGLWHAEHPGQLTEYRRADLPPTLAQALALPEIAALVDAAHRVNHDNLHGNGLEGFRYGRERLSRALGAIDDAIAKVQP